MPEKEKSRAKGLLVWHAACERLSNSLQPPPGTPAATTDELRAALKLARTALDELELIYLPDDRTTDPS